MPASPFSVAPDTSRRKLLRSAQLLLLVLLSFGLLLEPYRPLLDDSIQYYNYANLMGSLPEAVSKLGLLAARPIAGVLDIVLWSRFWGNLSLAAALVALLFTLSARHFERLFSDLFQTGPAFSLFYLLMPFSLEGVYWLSASTRIVPSLLLAALCGRASLAAFGGERPVSVKHAALAALYCLLTLGFYEQGFVLAASLMGLTALLRMRGKPLRLAVAAAIPLCCFVAYRAFCASAGSSALYGARSQLLLPVGSGGTEWRNTLLPQLLPQLAALCKAVWALPLRALRLSANLPLFPGAAFSLAGAALACSLSKGAAGQNRARSVLPCALLLAAAPLAPFFVLPNPWVSLRALACCLPGIALCAEALFSPLKHGRMRAAAVFALAFCCLQATRFEVTCYARTAQADDAAVRGIAAALPQTEGAKRIAVLGLAPSYLKEQSFEWHEHIHGVTESRWALTGALRARRGSLNAPVVTPLREGDVYPDYADISEYDAFLLLTTAPDRLGEHPPVPVYPDGSGNFYTREGALAATLTPPPRPTLTVYPPSN